MTLRDPRGKSNEARTDVIGDSVSGSEDNINGSNKNRVSSRNRCRAQSVDKVRTAVDAELRHNRATRPPVASIC